MPPSEEGPEETSWSLAIQGTHIEGTSGAFGQSQLKTKQMEYRLLTKRNRPPAVLSRHAKCVRFFSKLTDVFCLSAFIKNSRLRLTPNFYQIKNSCNFEMMCMCRCLCVCANEFGCSQRSKEGVCLVPWRCSSHEPPSWSAENYT